MGAVIAVLIVAAVTWLTRWGGVYVMSFVPISPWIRRFIQALARATAAAQRDPQAATDALLKAAPDLDKGFAAASVLATLPVLFPESKSRPFGWQDPAQWDTFSAWMKQNGLLDHPPDPAAAHNNTLLPGAGL